MLRQSFHRIMHEYPQAIQEELTDHPLATHIRHKLPEICRSYFPETDNLIWHASSGQGRWADAPWLAAFNPLITDTARRGYYPVYLFSNSLDRVYLSMNQGMTALKDEFGSGTARDTLEHRANIIQNRLSNEFPQLFDTRPIDLQASGQSTRLAFYEPGHAFGKVYLRDSMPSNDELVNDLGYMLNLYSLLHSRGGVTELISDTEQPDEPSIPDTMEERRRFRYHKSIERNSRLSKAAKEYHGYVCQICGFDFEKEYGELGKEYIEAHHLVPISELPQGQVTQLSPVDDFAVLCANCHRMIHRKNAPGTLRELHEVYRLLHDE